MDRPLSDYVWRRFKVLRVVDGDTLDVEVDPGFRLKTIQRFRLHGFNAPESRGSERPWGVRATEFLRALVTESGPEFLAELHSFEDPDAFGRYLADIRLANGAWLTEVMIAGRHGVAWDYKADRKRPTPWLSNPEDWPL